MIYKYFIAVITLLVSAFITLADEIVLQNGLNGYNGCSDTHLKSLGDGEKFQFVLQDENYHSNLIIETAN